MYTMIISTLKSNKRRLFLRMTEEELIHRILRRKLELLTEGSDLNSGHVNVYLQLLNLIIFKVATSLV